MDEGRTNRGQETQERRIKMPSQEARVSFPKARKKGINKRIVIIFIVIALVLVAVGFFISREEKLVLSPVSTPTPSEEATPTPSPEPINKEDIKIEVLNGTEIAGEAAFLQSQLGDLGYEDIEIGNADSQDFVATKVVFSPEVSDTVKNEILDKLDDLYEDVETDTSSMDTFDIQVTIGYRKDHAPTPTKDAGSTSTPTPTSTESASLKLIPLL
jgi:hypothetical protein